MRPYGRVRRCAHAVVRRVTTPYPSTARPRPAKISTAVSRLTVLLVLAPCTIEAPGSSPLPPLPTHTHPPNPLSPAFPRSHFVPTPSAAQIQSELSRTRSKAVIVQARSRASASSHT